MILSLLLLSITVGILYVFYSIILYPMIRTSIIKMKHGDKVKVILHYGTGLLTQYKKCFAQDQDSMSFIRKMAKEHTTNLSAFCFNLGGKIGFSFVDPDLIKQVHQNHEVFKKVEISQAITYLFSSSCLFAYGKGWTRQRKFVGQYFHYDEIRNYLPIIKETCMNVSQKIKEDLLNKSQVEIQVVKSCEKVTSEVVFKVFFGSNSENLIIKRQDGSELLVQNELIQIIMDSYRLIQSSKFTLIKTILLKRKSLYYFPSKQEKELLNRLTNIREKCNQVIQKRRKELMQDPSKYKKNFLDQYLREVLINKVEEITNDEIIQNFLGLIFAGTDTTGNMTGTALYYLSIHPQIQQQARDEILKLALSKSKSNNPDELFSSLTFEDFTNMHFLNSILKESLRLIPPAAGVFPRYACQDIKIGQFLVKKGDLINTHFLYNQNNPQVFANPDQFDPYRWLNTKEQNPFNFTPFSLGPRNCIGQHMAMVEGKCILANILLNFNVLQNPYIKIQKEMKIIYGLQPDNVVFYEKRYQL